MRHLSLAEKQNFLSSLHRSKEKCILRKGHKSYGPKQNEESTVKNPQKSPRTKENGGERRRGIRDRIGKDDSENSATQWGSFCKLCHQSMS